MNFKYILLALSVFVMFSCGDGDSPVITINSPDNGATYAPGSVVNVNATITDDIGVTTVNVLSTELGINESNMVSPSEANLTFNFNLTLGVETPVDEYEITFTATDTEGNFSDEKLTIKVE